MKKTRFIRKWGAAEKPSDQAKAVSKWLNKGKDE
jgi:hypothetical protein